MLNGQTEVLDLSFGNPLKTGSLDVAKDSFNREMIKAVIWSITAKYILRKATKFVILNPSLSFRINSVKNPLRILFRTEQRPQDDN